MDKNYERMAEILGVPKERLEEAARQVEDEETHLYYNPDLFMGLVKPNMNRLASLVVPDLSRLRR